jgi:hypothetical protein
MGPAARLATLADVGPLVFDTASGPTFTGEPRGIVRFTLAAKADPSPTSAEAGAAAISSAAAIDSPTTPPCLNLWIFTLNLRFVITLRHKAFHGEVIACSVHR